MADNKKKSNSGSKKSSSKSSAAKANSTKNSGKNNAQSVNSSSQARTPSSRLEVNSGKYMVSQQSPSKNNDKNQKKTAAAKGGASPLKNKINNIKNSIDLDIAARVAFGVVVVILAVLLFSFQKVDTQTALLTTISQSIETTGYAVRNESVIITTKNGTFVSTVENGSKVSKGETIVNVFSSAEEAAAYQRVLEINNALEKFEQMKTAGEDNAAEISVIQKQMDNNLLTFSKYVANGEIKDACELSEDILYYFNKNQIATKVVENYSERVEELKKERNDLISKYSLSPDVVKTSISGYFIDTVDGYEELLDSSVLEGLTPDGLEQIVSQRREPNLTGVVGKIADGYTWHIVSIVTAEEAASLEKNKNYNISFPYSDAERISAKLVTLTPDESGERVLLTFRCTTMVSELSVLRDPQMIIELYDITGIEVDKDCLVTIVKETEVSDSDAVGGSYTVYDEQLGVYILWDNEIKFRRVEVLYMSEDKVICKVKNTGNWLKLYDEVVLDTENMYEGKIINNGR